MDVSRDDRLPRHPDRLPGGGPAPVFAAGPPLTLSTIALGNIFTDGQQVQVGLSTSAPSVSWSVTDINGATVTSGSQATASGNITVPITTRPTYIKGSTVDFVTSP